MNRCPGQSHITQAWHAVLIGLAATVLFPLTPRFACASDYVAGPESYLRALALLGPGDTLTLRPGLYRKGLPLHDLHGDAQRGIVIRGPRAGAPAVLLGRPGANTVSLESASYIAVRDLWLDGLHLPVDAVKAEGRGGPIHHITLERLTIVGHDYAQDVVAISTKRPAWGWVIRENYIIGAGTGVYLGDSDGSAPFIGGIIENNVIVDTIGYNIEIKHQAERPQLPDAPAGQSVTILRNNVFAKARNSSTGKLARPNVLVGHFPLRGRGRSDRYDIVDNIFFDNASEALFQGEGNLLIERNIFFNPHGNAVAVQPQHDVPRRVSIVDNFVAAARRGVRVRGGDSRLQQSVARNAVYAGEALDGGLPQDNVIGPLSAAPAALPGWLARVGGTALRATHLRSMERRLCAPDGRAASLVGGRAYPTRPDSALCTFLHTLVSAAAPG